MSSRPSGVSREWRDLLSPGSKQVPPLRARPSTPTSAKAALVGDPATREIGESEKNAGAPVGEYLADQLLIPMALAGGGSFTTSTPTLHTTTNIEVIKKFLPVEITTTQLTEDVWKVEVSG